MSRLQCSIALLVGSLAACGSPQSPNATSPTKPTSPVTAAPVATDLDLLNDVDLPSAQNTSPLLDDHVPIVTVTGGKILCDGEVVGDAGAIRRLERLDGVWENLKHARESWKNAHVGHPFPGVALFAFDRNASANVVESVFQTAAFAGYPNAQFAVRNSLHVIARVNVDAIVPSPAGTKSPPGDRLLVAVHPSKYDFVWRRGETDLATVDVASAHDLPDAIGKMIAKNSTHRQSSDAVRDEAVLFVSDDVDYAGIVAVIDALEGPTRDIVIGGSTMHVPAMNVSLSVGKAISTGDPLVFGPEK